jgi:hypothetical protein
MLLTEGAVREAIHMNARSDEVLALARASGFRSLQEDALEKIQSGQSTLEEIQRVVPWDTIRFQYCRSCQKEVQAGSRYCPSCGAKRQNETPAKKKEILAGALQR